MFFFFFFFGGPINNMLVFPYQTFCIYDIVKENILVENTTGTCKYVIVIAVGFIIMRLYMHVTSME